MFFNKKGDLAISTNAIVVLIIAVIMLGLIIGFVSRGFGAVSDKFFGEVEKLPEPQQPTASNPITTSELTLVRAGDQFGMKIGVYSAAGATGVTPSIACQGLTFEGTPQVTAKDIGVGQSATFIYIAKVPSSGVDTGKKLCTVTADSKTADLIIEVRE